MNEFEIAKLTLETIVIKKEGKEEVPFALAIKNSFKKYNVEPQSRNNITALLGCVLRHHYLLDNLIHRFFVDIEFEKTIYLRFLISNKLFLKRFNNDELLKLTVADLDKDLVSQLVEFVSSTKEIIPNNLDKTSPEYLSMRFNTPAWVIKMWQKQFGKGVVFKVLKTNYRQSIPSIRVNEQLTTKEKVLAKHPDLVASPIENVLVFHGKGSPKYFEEFKKNEIFFMKMGTKFILDKLEIEPIKRIAIYSDVPNNIYLDLVSRFGNNIAMDLIINHTQSYYETKRICENFKYNNIALYHAASSSIITCVSNKVGTMICLPKSTTFDLLRSTPDYFLRVKQDQLDSIIAEEKAALEECANLVERDGKFVYMVPTMSKKESTTLIANFLFLHPDYSLIEERQFFPFDEFDSCLYYAILKKTGESGD